METGAIWGLMALRCDFSLQVPRFIVVAGMAGGLEAFSVQNDNLTLPLYMWAMVVLVDVVDQRGAGA